MATGRSNQLTRQIGEHLVAAELGRQGFIATPFAGNVPNFDLLVANEVGVAIPVQVKAINGPSSNAWQFDVRRFLKIKLGKDRQMVLGRESTPHPGLVCVLVLLGEAGTDQFFTLRFKDLQTFFARTYKGRKRPKKITSFHCAIWAKHIQKFQNWNALHDAFKRTQKR